MEYFLRIAAAVGIAQFGFWTAALAAEFEYQDLELPVVQYGDIGAEIVMTGPIEIGDADRLEALLRQHQDFANHSLRLRLNSLGGSLDAGIALANMTQSKGLQTYVGAGESCLSACALVFMSGNIKDGDDSWSSLRVMHHDATIGFHAPAAFESGMTLPAAAAEVVMSDVERSSRLAVAALLQLSVDGRIPTDLLEEFIQVDPTEFLVIDTVDKAGRWSIEIEDAQPIYTLENIERISEYCTNIHAWRDGVAFEERSENAGVMLFSIEDGARLASAMMDFDCDVSLTQVREYDREVAFADGLGIIKAWQTLPANIALSSFGPEEVPNAIGATWAERFPEPNVDGVIDYESIRAVSGACRDGLYWLGGWRGDNGELVSDYGDATTSHATVAACGGGFGPLSITCSFGSAELELRFAYADGQTPNADGLAIADIDGTAFYFTGENGDVFGLPQVFDTLEIGHPFLDALKSGSMLQLIGDGPNQTIHLSGSKRSIEAMELACQ